jgi:ribosomal-protein-alanine N-acetyltransferase
VISEIETRRLVLVPLALADAAQTQPLFGQWEIVKFLSDVVPWPFPPDGAFMFYRDVALPAMERGDAWHWTLRLKAAPDQIIGSISLMKGETNRGFWLGIPWQGQGLMTEAAEAVTAWWFETLGFPVMRIPKAIANVTSRRVSEKQGMRVVRTEERGYVCGCLPTEIWEITAEEWRARQASRARIAPQ